MQYNRGMTWRLGATSYVYAGDLLHNLARLAGQVQDVELVLFDDGAGNGNVPTVADVQTMRQFLADHGMSVTVHLPVDLGGANDSQRRAALALNQRVVETTLPLNPYAWIVHIETARAGTREWLDAAVKDVEQLCATIGDPAQLAIENLESYPPELLEPLFTEFPVARALDVGHLWKQQRDPLPVAAAWLDATRVFHLHGVCRQDDRLIDHASLAVLDAVQLAQLDALLDALRDWHGVLTLEVFEGDYFTSRPILDRVLVRRTKRSAAHVA